MHSLALGWSTGGSAPRGSNVTVKATRDPVLLMRKGLNRSSPGSQFSSHHLAGESCRAAHVVHPLFPAPRRRRFARVRGRRRDVYRLYLGHRLKGVGGPRRATRLQYRAKRRSDPRVPAAHHNQCSPPWFQGDLRAGHAKDLLKSSPAAPRWSRLRKDRRPMPQDKNIARARRKGIRVAKGGV